jgi:hypothetical protein
MKDPLTKKIKSTIGPSRCRVLRKNNGTDCRAASAGGSEGKSLFLDRSVTECDSNSAAAYVRMAAENPHYLTGRQMNRIRKDAKRLKLEIARLFLDNGKTGTEAQSSLSEMIRDIHSGRFGFSHLLIQDVSRWGRTPDADASIHYEEIFHRAGIAIHFCTDESGITEAGGPAHCCSN